jgi:hypothetical protein
MLVIERIRQLLRSARRTHRVVAVLVVTILVVVVGPGLTKVSAFVSDGVAVFRGYSHLFPVWKIGRALYRDPLARLVLFVVLARASFARRMVGRKRAVSGLPTAGIEASPSLSAVRSSSGVG